MKLWKGRFSKDPEGEVLEFNSAENIELDARLAGYDILGSIAHVRMLAKQGIIDGKEEDAILKALKQLHRDWERGAFTLSKEHEDVHMNVEVAVSRRTEHGKKMHTARSRNDQALLDMRMYMRDSILEVSEGIVRLQKTLAKLKEGPMAGYTHTRVAQPITASLWADALVQGLQRDMERLMDCYRRVNRNPLGACALAGTGWEIDRAYTAKLLAFDGVQENEVDTINSRGEMEAELLAHLSILMARLSGLAEELIWLSEKGLVGLPDSLCTGSSIMPNKKNPDILELVRGRSGRVYGCLTHALTVKKGLIHGYHSDMQETKYAVMQGVDTAKACLDIMALAVQGAGFDKERIVAQLEQGFAQATEIADFLAMQGVPFREAHGKVGKLVSFCEKKGTTLSKLDSKEAEGILGIAITAKQWRGLVSVERKRLQRDIALPRNSLKKEKDRIKKAYADLCGR